MVSLSPCRALLCLASVLLLLTACGDGSNAGSSSEKKTLREPQGPLVDDELSNILIGSWEAHSLSITMPTHLGADSTAFVSITPENWKAVVGLEPVKTHFFASGEYVAEYYDLQGNLMKRPRGFWAVQSNVLTYEETEPAPNRFFQQVAYLGNNFYEFSYVMDYDGDGEADDEAVAVSRKLE